MPERQAADGDANEKHCDDRWLSRLTLSCSVPKHPYNVNWSTRPFSMGNGVVNVSNRRPLPGAARGEDEPGDVEIAPRLLLAMEGVKCRSR